MHSLNILIQDNSKGQGMNMMQQNQQQSQFGGNLINQEFQNYPNPNQPPPHHNQYRGGGGGGYGATMQMMQNGNNVNSNFGFNSNNIGQNQNTSQPPINNSNPNLMMNMQKNYNPPNMMNRGMNNTINNLPPPPTHTIPQPQQQPNMYQNSQINIPIQPQIMMNSSNNINNSQGLIISQQQQQLQQNQMISNNNNISGQHNLLGMQQTQQQQQQQQQQLFQSQQIGFANNNLMNNVVQVRNIYNQAEDKDILEYMQCAGTIINYNIKKEDQRVSGQYQRVSGQFTYSDNESAQIAVKLLDNLKICGSSRELKVRLVNGNNASLSNPNNQTDDFFNLNNNEDGGKGVEKLDVYEKLEQSKNLEEALKTLDDSAQCSLINVFKKFIEQSDEEQLINLLANRPFLCDILMNMMKKQYRVQIPDVNAAPQFQPPQMTQNKNYNLNDEPKLIQKNINNLNQQANMKQQLQNQQQQQNNYLQQPPMQPQQTGYIGQGQIPPPPTNQQQQQLPPHFMPNNPSQGQSNQYMNAPPNQNQNQGGFIPQNQNKNMYQFNQQGNQFNNMNNNQNNLNSSIGNNNYNQKQNQNMQPNMPNNNNNNNSMMNQRFMQNNNNLNNLNNSNNQMRFNQNKQY
ncbi:hypothetical protein TTHERM_00812830 (macronuclear) [Tetrahymena thermophila SB210]|uniref:RRM domain-containing protein n=1 Tax=Tetrahymena thermophila (strain SB210) TaxID=312017 RepID=Q22SU8_TETTS|nr:hypothetical protein TTHERM_00812830 [Tetrahymena thermophila SB210]EAR88366.1 hypothetical protein TTHERM_00812830 [Tetrahymena thermophila SB210]|eukprot:XP_001008611.1 hypothetical protein TTHERM_00812830 [Tetrahymena thermophila SB210]